MKRLLLILGLLTTCAHSATVTVGTLTSIGYPFAPAQWTWPVSNSGPYDVLSGVTSVTITTPNGQAITENDQATHQYNHIPRIWWDAGTTYLAFSSCATNEGDGGQQVWVTLSSNKGVTWTAPVLACPAQSNWTNVPVLYGGNGAYESQMRLTYPHTWRKLTGTNWLTISVDQSYDTNGNVYGVAMFALPVFADGTLGTLVRISTNAYASVDGKPLPDFDANARTALMTNTILFGQWGGGYLSPTEWTEQIRTNDSVFVEPTTFPATDNGDVNLWRLWRCLGPASVATNTFQEYSRNNGATWSGLTTALIPNAPSVICGLRLTTKQFAILGNPHNSGGWGRDPLYLALATPGTTTITNVGAIRQAVNPTPTWPGWGKGGGASYVNAVQVGNYLYAGYSMRKEDIGFSRVLIPGLADNNNDVP